MRNKRTARDFKAEMVRDILYDALSSHKIFMDYDHIKQNKTRVARVRNAVRKYSYMIVDFSDLKNQPVKINGKKLL